LSNSTFEIYDRKVWTKFLSKKILKGMESDIEFILFEDDSEKKVPSRAYQMTKEDITHLVNIMNRIEFNFHGK
jgi:hypothetical protein